MVGKRHDESTYLATAWLSFHYTHVYDYNHFHFDLY